MISALKELLSRYSPSSIIARGSVMASVLVPVFENGDGTHLVLTRRTTTVKYHKGEISFPGGMYEEGDGHTMKTAIRECYEEIGVKETDLEIIGRLDDVETMTGFIIVPYVAVIPYPYDFRLNPYEVNYLIHLPLRHLLEATPVMEVGEYAGRTEQVPTIYYQGEKIWGATCRMLLRLKRILEDAHV